MQAGGSPLAEEASSTLLEQRRVWERRPLVRRLYHDWFELLAARLSGVEGDTLEIGAGFGAFKEVRPDVIATDTVKTPWADRVVDAEALPFDDGSLANVVMLDVLHHVPRPASAIREFARALAPGGRVVMIEPYCAPLSTLAYRYLHHEDLDLDADPDRPQSSDDPFDANIALPTIIFWRRPELLRRWAPELGIVELDRFSWLVYPLSGGFGRRSLLGERIGAPLLAVERLLSPLVAPILAFRGLIVLERAP